MKRLALMAVLLLVGCSGSTTATAPVAPPNSPIVTAAPAATATPDATVAAATAPLPSDAAAKLEAIVRRQFEGTNNLGAPFFRKVTVIDQASGFAVVVEFNASDNLSERFIVVGIENEMEELFTALYTSNVPVNRVRIAAFMPLSDAGGNVEDSIVYRTTLDGTKASGINWGNPDGIRWPDLWTVDQVIAQFEDDIS